MDELSFFEYLVEINAYRREELETMPKHFWTNEWDIRADQYKSYCEVNDYDWEDLGWQLNGIKTYK